MREARDQAAVLPDGVLRFTNRPKFLADLKRLQGETVTVHVFCGVTKKARGYYRGVVVPAIAEQIGHDEDTTHSLLKAKFNPLIITSTTKNGQIVKQKLGGSFEDLGSAGFAKMVETVVWWGRDFLGAEIRDPSPEERAAMRGKES